MRGMNALNARRRLRTNVSRGDVRTTALDNKLSVARTRVREASKVVKRYMRVIERRWWEGVIGECKETCDRRRIGDM